MNAIPFDTLKMARKLEAAGFPGPQAAGAAEAMAEAMSGAELATKADLQAVKADMERRFARDPTGQQLQWRFRPIAAEGRLTCALVGRRSALGYFRHAMSVWFVAIMVAHTAIVIAGMRLILMQG